MAFALPALPALTALASTAPGVGVAAGAIGGASAAAGGIGWLSSALGLMSVATTMFGSFMRGQAMDTQAAWEEFGARNEVLRGQQDANRIKDRALQQMASAAARYAAGGVDIGSGTPETMERQIQDVADRETSIARYDAKVGSAIRTANADARTSVAMAMRVAGFGSAIRPLASMYASDRRLYG